jgi:hypothetical protein
MVLRTLIGGSLALVLGTQPGTVTLGTPPAVSRSRRPAPDQCGGDDRPQPQRFSGSIPPDPPPQGPPHPQPWGHEG